MTKHIPDWNSPRLLSIALIILLLLAGCTPSQVDSDPATVSLQDTNASAVTALATAPTTATAAAPPIDPTSVLTSDALQLGVNQVQDMYTPSPAPSVPVPSPTALPALAMTSTAPAPPTPNAPQVHAFTAEPVEAGEEKSIALSWEATGERATLCPLIGDKVVGCRCVFDVPLVGSHTIKPSEIIGNYSGFQLTVEAKGIRTVRYAPLAVACPDSFPDWFFDNPPGLCPKDAPLPSYAAAQRFEHGLMIWSEAQDAYYVLFDYHLAAAESPQGTSSLTSLRIIKGPLDLKPGASADNRVAETPPPGRFEPVSGFGLLWRGEVTGTEDLRAALGWALEPEYGFDTVYQCAMSCSSSWDCYLRGPKGEVFHLYWLMHIGHFWEVEKHTYQN